ncbi:hypothetical protein Dfri01_58860 [Dyadobacter frigoris]|jgi:hypothetical protein|uniref:hypothetical protein n=1 Tax=Dyadobacter frigoris TaxID=2576211 RepID=UPI0024A4B96E|nr:hypothetical protein [Dyadobacter frigoris]GLU56425.1 hypothetical protein Dfri01_58860 [Dyadobacter frigoris]
MDYTPLFIFIRKAHEDTAVFLPVVIIFCKRFCTDKKWIKKKAERENFAGVHTDR